MGDHCTIEWVVALAQQLNAIPASLNPIRGCSRQSRACWNCYAAGIAHRFGHKGNGIYAGLTDLDLEGTPRFNGTLRWVPEVLETPIRAKRSRVYFVCDMSDLFYRAVDQAWIDQVFAMMALCRHHHFLLLTKRPERMRQYLTDPETPRRVAVHANVLGGQSSRADDLHFGLMVSGNACDGLVSWPLPNVWIGATVEDRCTANLRIPHLLAAPAVRRFLSCEPLMGPVDLTAIPWRFNGCSGKTVKTINALTGNITVNDPVFGGGGGVVGLDWVITGGESGPKARASHPDWFRSLRDQCEAAGVAFLFKQWGEWLPSEEVPSEQQESLELQNRDGFVETEDDLVSVYRVGKKAAGRVLDGRTWDEVPEVRP